MTLHKKSYGSRYTTITIEEAIEQFSPPAPTPITIAGHEVEFLSDGRVKVGCQTVTDETMARIERRLAFKPIMINGLHFSFWTRGQGKIDYMQWDGKYLPTADVHEIIKRWKEARK